MEVDGKNIEKGLTGVQSDMTGDESGVPSVESGVTSVESGVTSVESGVTSVESVMIGVESVQQVESRGQTKVDDTTEPVDTSVGMESSDVLQDSAVGVDNSQRAIPSSVELAADCAPQESAVTSPGGSSTIIQSTNTESCSMPALSPGGNSTTTLSNDTVSHGTPVTPSGSSSTTIESEGRPAVSGGEMAKEKPNTVKRSGGEPVDDKLEQNTTKGDRIETPTTHRSGQGMEQVISIGPIDSRPNSSESSEIQHTQEADDKGWVGDCPVTLSSGEAEMDVAPSDRQLTTVVTTEGGDETELTEDGTDMQVDVR